MSFKEGDEVVVISDHPFWINRTGTVIEVMRCNYFLCKSFNESYTFEVYDYEIRKLTKLELALK